METVLEYEKIIAPPIIRKKIRADEVYKMVEVGILPEESGWELINGKIVRNLSIGSLHVGIIIKLCKLFERKFGEFVFVSSQNPVHIDDHNEPEPDIVLLKPRDDFYTRKLPVPSDVLLLIEISDSTLNYDRAVKKVLYAEAEIEEFWIVNLKGNTIECYSSPKNGNYHLTRILEKGETVESNAVKNLKLSVEEILGL